MDCGMMTNFYIILFLLLASSPFITRRVVQYYGGREDVAYYIKVFMCISPLIMYTICAYERMKLNKEIERQRERRNREQQSERNQKESSKKR
ncbi:hypothetical protein PFBG_05787 [Plasmodium falciparum 7G8]|uniref:Uncharacterized protein n=3 Tax=Plasmodium falciparum TaxID=5833 RepID=A0A024UYV1_PLAFA|nr:hypothetical protein PFFVO_05360 [Plasmodium falciparum Vietnam Oak-Knoll (FVO)]ETW39522.1 hypothetical protein PFNF135_05552 [Plasmodium falciparum NF135/5.C10]EUR62071.1 hypothetical protein PFBG_05787 [Plasmodium falciparum 7G8]